MATEDTPDEELYAAWERGDKPSAEALIDRHLRSIGRFFVNKVTDAPDAEDLASRVFEVVARNLGAFERNSSFRTYLFGIARNVLREYIRYKRRRPGEVDFRVTAVRDLGPSPSAIVAERKDQLLLLQALRAIPLAYQTVIELSYFENLTQAEIAKLLAVPPGTVASRIRRGKKMLDEKMEELAESQDVLESTRHGLQDWADSVRKQLAEFDTHDEPL